MATRTSGPRATRWRRTPLAVLAATTGLLHAAPAGAVVFSNPTPLQSEVLPTCGPYKTAPVYPSAITVSGLSGTVTDVNVTLHDFAAQSRDAGPFPGYAEDADILLEAPNGTNLMLMSDVGGDDNSSANVSGVDITIDDSAPNSLPTDTHFVSNTAVAGKPTDDDDDGEEAFGIEAPDQFSNSLTCPPIPDLSIEDTYTFAGPTPSANTSLAVFNGLDPNGTWKLWFVDDYGGGQIVAVDGGWSLDITTGPPTCFGQPATLVGTLGNDTLIGTPGPDVIVSLDGDDMVDGRGGDDRICGGEGADRVAAGDGNDSVSGGEGLDQVAGGSGNDQLSGDGGDDYLAGGTGTDSCSGGTGVNNFSGCEATGLG